MTNLKHKLKDEWISIANQLIQFLTVLQLGHVLFKIWDYHWLASDPLTKEMFKYILESHVAFGLYLIVGLIAMIGLTAFKKYLGSVIVGILILGYTSIRIWTF